MHLRNVCPFFRAATHDGRRETQIVSEQVSFAEAGVLGSRNAKDLRIISLLGPSSAKTRKSKSQVNTDFGVRVGSRGVIHGKRRILFGAMRMRRRREGDLSIGDAHPRSATINVALLRSGISRWCENFRERRRCFQHSILFSLQESWPSSRRLQNR